MPSTIILKRRIGSIKSTRQITKAMQLVSASKLRRVQEYALQSQAYAELANELLTRLSGINGVSSQPLFVARDVQSRTHVVITSSSGLAGAYNTNVLKQLTSALQDDRNHKVASSVIVVGSKGAHFVRRLQDVTLLAAYPTYGNKPTANDVRPLLNMIIKQYISGVTDQVDIIYTKFQSSLSQQVQKQQLLPVQPLTTETAVTAISNFEPDVETVINQVATRLIEAQIWEAILQSLVSEHAMRMVAMKSATDNAKELIDDYTLELNTARQAAITQELTEITGGAEALK